MYAKLPVMADTNETSRRPAPRMSKYGFMLYPVYNNDGNLIWVSIPERDR